MAVLNADVNHTDHHTLSGVCRGEQATGVVVDIIHSGEVAGIVIEKLHTVAKRYVPDSRHLPGLSEDIDRDGGGIEEPMVMAQRNPEGLKGSRRPLVIKDDIRSHRRTLFDRGGAALLDIDLHGGDSETFPGEHQPGVRSQGLAGGRDGRQPHGCNEKS